MKNQNTYQKVIQNQNIMIIKNVVAALNQIYEHY